MDFEATSALERDDAVSMAASLYAASGSSGAIGAFVGGSSKLRTELLDQYLCEPLPEEILQAAVELPDDSVQWALCQRRDLPQDVLHTLVQSKSPLVLRTLAQNMDLTDEMLRELLPGDEVVRQRVFVHPSTSRETRLSILYASASDGGPLVVSPTMTDELQHAEYAVWLSRSPHSEHHKLALSQLRLLSASQQWDVLQSVADGFVSLIAAVSSTGWRRGFLDLLKTAVGILGKDGNVAALSHLREVLDRKGRPPSDPVDEASQLPDAADASALKEEILSWGALETALKDDRMTPAAVRYLLTRDDRTSSFSASAVVYQGHIPGVIELCSLSDLQTAVLMTGFVPTERSRLLRLLVRHTPCGYSLLDLWGGFPLADLLVEIDQVEEPYKRLCTAKLGSELDTVLGEDPATWERFEQLRSGSRAVTLSEAVTRSRPRQE